jgi:RNA polymerase sigma-70 factor, ECF subfamily
LSEQELIQQILAGDEAAKTRFYETHVNRMKPICVHFLGYQDSDIDDIIQQTFLIAFQKLPEFEPRSTLYTWIAHICVNLCYERLRKRKRTLVGMEEDLDQLTASLVHAREEERAQKDEEQSKIKLLDRLIQTMSDKCRKIIELRDRGGTSYAQIGTVLKIPIGTVMSQLARCRETLKKLVESALQGNF